VVTDGERSKRVLIAATVFTIVLICVVGYLSTGVFSLLCGIEEGKGYCGRVSEGKFTIEELGLVLAPATVVVSAGVLSVRRGSARPLLRVSLALIPIAVLLPLFILVVWK
jgi:hypothetical protein